MRLEFLLSKLGMVWVQVIHHQGDSDTKQVSLYHNIMYSSEFKIIDNKLSDDKIHLSCKVHNSYPNFNNDNMDEIFQLNGHQSIKKYSIYHLVDNKNDESLLMGYIEEYDLKLSIKENFESKKVFIESFTDGKDIYNISINDHICNIFSYYHTIERNIKIDIIFSDINKIETLNVQVRNHDKKIKGNFINKEVSLYSFE